MKILLINNNPVVSRLTALSARKENISLDEIKNISELKASDYNIIFVDGESYNNDVSNIIRNSGVEKRVLFYAEGEDENQSIFTQSILKPFLPSEVSEILRETKVTLLKSKETEKTEEPKEKKENVNFQDLVEETKNKELESLNIMKKEEKIDFEKDEFDLKIEEAFPLNLDNNKKEEKRVEKKSDTPKKDMFDLDSDLFELDTKKESNFSNKEDDLFELDDKKQSLKEDFDDNLFEIDKEIKKDILNDLPLDFDTESKNEINFSSNTPKIEKEETKIVEKEVKEDIRMTAKSEVTTKVLNNEDIADIKDILDEKEGSEKLTEIPTSLMKVKESITEKSIDTKKSVNKEEILKQEVLEKKEIIEEKEIQEKKTQKEEIASMEEDLLQEISSIGETEKKKKKKKRYSDELSTGVAIAHTLSKLPVKELRQLLRGAKVNISIEFSNKI